MDVPITRNALAIEGKAFGEEAIAGEMIAVYLAYGAQEAYFLGLVIEVARDILEAEDWRSGAREPFMGRMECSKFDIDGQERIRVDGRAVKEDEPADRVITIRRYRGNGPTLSATESVIWCHESKERRKQCGSVTPST